MSFEKEVAEFMANETGSQCPVDNSRIRLSGGTTFLLRSIKDPQKPAEGERVIWEDQWVNKKPIVQSRIRSVIGNTKRIYARDTRLVSLTRPEADAFLEKNHLLGATGCKTKLGLTHDGSLVAVATFSGPTGIDRNQVRYRSYELIRFCPRLSHTIVGGLSKLIHHFIGLRQPDDLMTYVDVEWSNGRSYQRLGFELVEQTPAQPFWIKRQDLSRHHKEPAPENMKDYAYIENEGNYKFILFRK